MVHSFVAKEETIALLFTLIAAQTYLDGVQDVAGVHTGETSLDGARLAETGLDGARAAQSRPC
jgi:hypothetical protein